MPDGSTMPAPVGEMPPVEGAMPPVVAQ
jgi:hypothetical protein